MNALPTITPADLARRLVGGDPPVVLAVASEAEFGRHRIPGSRRFADPDALRADVALNRPIVLTGCAHDDLACAWAAQLLHEHGFTDVRVLAGGIAAWAASGLPLEADRAHPPATSTRPDPHA